MSNITNEGVVWTIENATGSAHQHRATMFGPAGIQKRRPQTTLCPVPIDSWTKLPRERERQSNRRTRLHVWVINGQMTKADNTVSRPVAATRQRSKR